MNRQESAESLAFNVFLWLAGNDDLLPRFIDQTGFTAGDIAAHAQDPSFLAAVLDFLLTDDASVVAYCDAANESYDAPMQARMALPGGEQTHWT